MNLKNRIWDRKKLITAVGVLVVILLIVIILAVWPFGSRETGTETEPSDETVVTVGETETEPDETPEYQTTELEAENTTNEESEPETENTTDEEVEPVAEPSGESETGTVNNESTEEATEATTDGETAEANKPTDSAPLPEPPTQSGQSGGSTGDQSGPTSAPTEAPPETEPPIIEEEIASGDITCDEFGSFSGQYVEDGRDELVENVAAALVTNHSDEFLEFAIITININDNPATFVATGLPAGSSAWVLEIDWMKIGATASFDYVDCISSFREEAVTETDKLTITADGNMLTAKNNTDGKLSDVYVYYKAKHTDGNYLGGITYRVSFGTIEAGQSAESMAGHYDKETTEIVHIAWRTE